MCGLHAGPVDKLDSCRAQPCTIGMVSALEWGYGIDASKAPPLNEFVYVMFYGCLLYLGVNARPEPASRSRLKDVADS